MSAISLYGARYSSEIVLQMFATSFTTSFMTVMPSGSDEMHKFLCSFRKNI